MKKFAGICALMIIAASMTSCEKRMYATYASGMDQVAFLTVVSVGERPSQVFVVVDGTEHFYGKVEKEKNYRKAIPLELTPGYHSVQVKEDGKIIASEDFISVCSKPNDYGSNEKSGMDRIDFAPLCILRKQ
ncbi:MAG: hypothetical protein LUD68_06435 [Rikenellaceae bacterium]|nr:hypothetical protein [Rikenellaceae bacterium]